MYDRGERERGMVDVICLTATVRKRAVANSNKICRLEDNKLHGCRSSAPLFHDDTRVHREEGRVRCDAESATNGGLRILEKYSGYSVTEHHFLIKYIYFYIYI